MCELAKDRDKGALFAHLTAGGRQPRTRRVLGSDLVPRGDRLCVRNGLDYASLGNARKNADQAEGCRSRRSAGGCSELQSAQTRLACAKIVLLTADGHGTAEIMRRTGKATLPISTPRCWNGLRAIPAVSSTSPPPRRPGSMPSKGYSHYSLSGASARRFSFRLEIQGCYPQLHCRHERKFKTVYLDKRPRQDHCSRPTKVTNC